ncbi:MAG: glucosamine-6-phosphate isomerase [Verrucomicrobiales bacterium]|nr:glucosamine-6-phosphate isomerase [Verrucomicrobiales bacterium]
MGNALYPEYLKVSEADLGKGASVEVKVVDGMDEIAHAVADEMMAVVDAAQAEGCAATMIIPVGPVDQFPILAQMINKQGKGWREVVLINMDEYLDEDDQWVPEGHPLSFRGYMKRKFYDLIDPDLAPLEQNRVFPDPRDLSGIQKLIAARGGLDACFGGIGINGHMAFNEPPEPGELCSLEEFAARPTRNLNLSRETVTINSVTVGGGLAVIPRRAITVGMKEILAARKLRLYCNRLWQSAVVRKVLHDEVGPACPASYIRGHADARLTVAKYVAEPPDIALR